MRKCIDTIGLEPNALPRSRLTRFGRIALLLLMLPFAIDLTKVGTQRWQRMLGPVGSVETPALDYLSATYNALSQETYRFVGPVFRQVPWRVDHVIVAFILCALFGTFFLRRSH